MVERRKMRLKVSERAMAAVFCGAGDEKKVDVSKRGRALSKREV